MGGINLIKWVGYGALALGLWAGLSSQPVEAQSSVVAGLQSRIPQSNPAAAQIINAASADNYPRAIQQQAPSVSDKRYLSALKYIDSIYRELEHDAISENKQFNRLEHNAVAIFTKYTRGNEDKRIYIYDFDNYDIIKESAELESENFEKLSYGPFSISINLFKKSNLVSVYIDDPYFLSKELARINGKNKVDDQSPIVTSAAPWQIAPYK